jgi:hypothetical protein
MATKEKGPALNPDPTPTPSQASPTPATSVVRPAMRLPSERPDMPDAMHSNQLREQWQRERARRELVIDSIRCHLAEQPTPRAVRACARRWSRDIDFIADGVIAVLDRTETE